ADLSAPGAGDSAAVVSLPAVRARIDAACRRAGRSVGEVRLVAVTKGRTPDEIASLVRQGGVRDLGENRVQEWRDKKDLVPPGVHWHFVGNLQRNKVKYLADGAVGWVHSLNSARLADAMEAQGARRGHTFRALVEVNVFGESRKRGVPPGETEALVAHAHALEHVELVGLMAMAPFLDDPEGAREGFRRLRRLRDALDLREASMGMSRDFEVAIEEGATMVRIGSALFEGTAAQPPAPGDPPPGEARRRR
ncbi:MAG: YggS family pyridoxal phosphate-dependent enzyme, partial [Jiangellaceae bacterium]